MIPGSRAVRDQTPWEQSVIYETHVRGFTMRFPGLDPAVRGTFDGMADARVVEYVKSLGVTAVELLPVQYFPNDQHLEERELAPVSPDTQAVTV